MGRKCVFLTLALLLCIAISAEASVPETIRSISKSIVTVSVRNETGKTLRSGPGLIMDSEGIVLCSCSLVAKWAENLDYTLLVTLHDGSQLRIANLLSRPCSQGASYFRLSAQGLQAAPMSRGEGRNPKGSYYMYSPLSKPSDVRMMPLRSSPPDLFSHKAASDHGMHVQLNQKGEVLTVTITESVKGRTQMHTIGADETRDRLVHLRKTARRLASAARLPVPDVPPPPVTGKSLPPERMARIEVLKQQAGKTPENADIQIALGREYEAVHMNAEAIAAFAEALKRDPTSVKAHVHLGLAYYRASRYSDAIRSLSSAADLDSSLTDVQIKLGTIYLITGDYGRAIHSLKQAVAAAPDQPSLHFNLGLAYYLKGDKDGALGEYAILKRLNGEWAERLADLMY